MKKLFKVFIFSFLLIHFCACTEDSLLNDNNIEDNNIGDNITQVLTKSEAITKYSEILSKATYNEPELRVFLKNQALLKKDNDHNIFYPLTKNEIVYDNKTFAQVLEKYADSKKALSEIENSIPLLNIFIPDLTLFDEELSVENLDTKDNSIPIFSTGKFFVDGNIVDSISSGDVAEFPLFHTFVINESHRRIIKSHTRLSSSDNIEYGFADEAYNPQKTNIIYPSTRVKIAYSEVKENIPELYNAKNSFVNINEFPSETLEAFKKVGPGTGSLRPMIYYNLNKIEDFNSPDAALDHRVKDVIYRMKIGKEFYNQLSLFQDQDFGSPFIKQEWYKRFKNKNSNQSYDHLAAHFWTSGNFTFKINVVTGTYNQLHTIIVSPKDLFTLTFKKEYKHKTAFSDARTKWMVNIEKIESKWVYPHKLNVDTRFSPWDPKTDSYKRSIFVSVAGSHKTKTREVEVTSTTMNKSSVSAGLNIPISKGNSNGKNSASLNLTGGWESNNTNSIKEKVTISITDKDREMGNNLFNFFGDSPILDVRNNKVYLETNRYGCFDMCIIPVNKNLAAQ